MFGKKKKISKPVGYWNEVQPMHKNILERFFGDQENFQEEASDFRRIELGFAASAAQSGICMKMYSYLSAISNIPWRDISFPGHGHTIPCDVIDGFSAVWLLDSRLLPQISAPSYPDFMGDKINLLWVIPLKETEFGRLKEMGTEEALKRLENDITEIHIFNGAEKGIASLDS